MQVGALHCTGPSDSRNEYSVSDHPIQGTNTVYRTIRFKERIQCIGSSEFTGPRESANVIPNWEECITGNYWAYYTHRVALGDAVDDASTKLLPWKCRISTMPVSIGGSENPRNRICAIFLPPQYSC